MAKRYLLVGRDQTRRFTDQKSVDGLEYDRVLWNWTKLD